jgi:hypothetical protein
MRGRIVLLKLREPLLPGGVIEFLLGVAELRPPWSRRVILFLTFSHLEGEQIGGASSCEP